MIYTAGVVDLQSSNGMLYGETGLKAIVEQKYFLDAEALAKVISNDLFLFSKGVTQAEDMTIIVLKSGATKQKN